MLNMGYAVLIIPLNLQEENEEYIKKENLSYSFTCKFKILYVHLPFKYEMKSVFLIFFISRFTTLWVGLEEEEKVERCKQLAAFAAAYDDMPSYGEAY